MRPLPRAQPGDLVAAQPGKMLFGWAPSSSSAPKTLSITVAPPLIAGTITRRSVTSVDVWPAVSLIS